MVGRPKKYFTEEERRAAATAYARKWREENRERYIENEKLRRIKSADKIKRNGKKWQDANKDRIKRWRRDRKEKEKKVYKQWKEKNIDRVREVRRNWERKRKEQNPLYKFKKNIRALIYNSFSRGNSEFKKSYKTEQILGCKLKFFIDYITKKCGRDLSISDFSRYGYHIDHIVPLSVAKTEEEIVKLCHYTNLQPLFWKDNLKKSDKI